MKAILWDGSKKINGEIILGEESIRFELADFSDTDLNFNITYNEISKVINFKLYDIAKVGIEIITDMKKRNVFIVENPKGLMQKIRRHCGLLTN